MRKHRAVVFDLWDTLVMWPVEDGRSAASRMASLLGVEPERFQEAWLEEYDRRWTGPLLPSVEAVCTRLGVATEHAAAVVEIRRAHTREVLVPRPGALDVLEELRGRGYRLGLISNCSGDVEEAWDASPLAVYFDRPVLSCSVGLRKPDPRIYELAAERGGAKPEECLFVDDQPAFAQGALEAGMDVVLIGSEPWDGRRIERLEQLLEALE